jgi:RHS repeat-associated protein
MGNLRYRQNHPTSPTIVESYEYDARGLMLTASKNNGGTVSSITMGYNGLGYMESSAQSIKGGTAKEVSYLRDQLGQMTRLTIPTATSTVLDYSYTSLGQIDTIKRGNDILVNYSYKGTFVTGRSYTQAGINLTNGYDNLGRLTSTQTINAGGQGVDFGYTYGYIDENTNYHNGDNILSQTYNHRDNDPANGFTYDPLNRLTNASYGMFSGGTETFNYDRLGNRTSTTDGRYFGSPCTYTPSTENNNEYDYICGTEVLYDAAGNLTRDKNGYTYRYDYENRLVEIRKTNDTIVIATFEYDALGRRIEKKDMLTGIAKRYYYDDQRIALQTSVSGSTETDEKYFIFGNYIDEVLVMHNLAGTYTGDFYYGHDHLYSPTVLFAYDSQQQSWEPCERYEYDVYGQCRILSTNYELRTTSSYANPYYFTGRELDSMDGGSCKLMYYRARSYDPQTGRFLQRDPLGVNPGGGKDNHFKVRKQYSGNMNLYGYVKSNPLVYLDSQGLSDIYIYCRNNQIIPWPINKIDHCTVIADGLRGEVPDMNAEDAKTYPVEVDNSIGRFLGGGPASGKPCSCASYSDILGCIAKKRNIGYHGIWPYLNGHNCQAAVARTLNSCCLKSKWEPSAPIDEPYGEPDPYPPTL